MSRSRFAPFLLLILACPPDPADAHEVRHHFSQQKASVVCLTYGDGSAFSYEQYELFFNDEEVPRQVGRTDAEGRITFLPHREGRWRMKAFSEDGHGVDLTIETGPSGTLAAAPATAVSHSRKLVTGISVIFGIFGLISLFLRRRPAP